MHVGVGSFTDTLIAQLVGNSASNYYMNIYQIPVIIREALATDTIPELEFINIS